MHYRMKIHYNPLHNDNQPPKCQTKGWKTLLNQMLVGLLTNVSAMGILVSNFSNNQMAFCTLPMKTAFN